MDAHPTDYLSVLRSTTSYEPLHFNEEDSWDTEVAADLLAGLSQINVTDLDSGLLTQTIPPPVRRITLGNYVFLCL